MKSAAFKGVTVAHITPFNNVGAIDIPSLRKLIDRQIEHGTDVILAAG